MINDKIAEKYVAGKNLLKTDVIVTATSIPHVIVDYAD